MKKYIGAISSALMGILTFVFLGLTWMSTKISAAGVSTDTTSTSAYDLIKESSEVDGFTLYKVFTIIAIVVACLLIVSAIIMILRNLNILKFKFSMNLINNILLILFLVCVVVAIIGLIMMCGELSGSAFGVEQSTTPGIGAWLTVAFAIVTTLVSLVFSKKAK